MFILVFFDGSSLLTVSLLLRMRQEQQPVIHHDSLKLLLVASVSLMPFHKVPHVGFLLLINTLQLLSAKSNLTYTDSNTAEQSTSELRGVLLTTRVINTHPSITLLWGWQQLQRHSWTFSMCIRSAAGVSFLLERFQDHTKEH